MTTSTRELATRAFSFTPTTLKEAQEYATIFANSGLCPEAYRGRPNDILIVWQLGKEIGLDKMQSLRTLGCVNGMPFAYGDGQLALIKRHPQFEGMREWFEGNLKDRTLTAYCEMKREGEEPVVQSFSIEDAMLAGLWGKKGTWTHYPRRMLQHRARGFAAKDAFPDALFGLMSQAEAEEVAESKVVEVREVKNKGMKGLEEALEVSQGAIIEGEVMVEEPLEEKVELTLHQQLEHWIKQSKTSKRSIDSWLVKMGVVSINDLSEDAVIKAIEYFKSKGEK